MEESDAMHQRNRILAGLIMLAASVLTLYEVWTDGAFLWIAIGVETAVVVGLLALVNRKKPDNGLRGRPNGDGL